MRNFVDGETLKAIISLLAPILATLIGIWLKNRLEKSRDDGRARSDTVVIAREGSTVVKGEGNRIGDDHSTHNYQHEEGKTIQVVGEGGSGIIGNGNHSPTHNHYHRAPAGRGDQSNQGGLFLFAFLAAAAATVVARYFGSHASEIIHGVVMAGYLAGGCIIAGGIIGIVGEAPIARVAIGFITKLVIWSAATWVLARSSEMVLPWYANMSGFGVWELLKDYSPSIDWVVRNIVGVSVAAVVYSFIVVEQIFRIFRQFRSIGGDQDVAGWRLPLASGGLLAVGTVCVYPPALHYLASLPHALMG
jgi:hypothetical protein